MMKLIEVSATMRSWNGTIKEEGLLWTMETATASFRSKVIFVFKAGQ